MYIFKLDFKINAKKFIENKTLKPGDGKSYPKVGQTVTVHYVGKFTNGKKFDSSRDKKKFFNFKLGCGKVILGWDEAVKQLSVGEIAEVICPPDYAYGPEGIEDVIPPNATLVFEIELISFK